MAERDEIPLHLCQVLEEEFESLHEPLDRRGADGREQADELPLSNERGETLLVTVRRDWDFHQNHFDRVKLVARLRQARRHWRRTRPGGGGPAEAAPASGTNLAAYLAARHPGLVDDATTPRNYVKLLSDILDDGEVFKRERFERLTSLRDETRAMAETFGWGGDGCSLSAVGGKASDLTRLRRLLLEDAFPAEIRRVYDLRLARVTRRIHALEKKRAAVCLSGGGIRSGTFALGVIQSLARRNFLDRFDYLSTVSGGGYIGGWLSAWIHRHRDGLRGVVSDLRGEGRSSKLEPEPEPLRHLRDYSNFITPKTGILSADSWTFVIIYVRNLLLNWVVLVPLLASLLVVPRVANAVVLAPPTWETLLWLLLLGGFGITLLKPGLGGLLRERLARVRPRSVLLLALLGIPVVAAALIWPEMYGRAEALLLDNPRAALLVAGATLSGYAVAFMRLNRPSNSGTIRPGSLWERRRDQSTFLWLCLLPLCLSSTLLTTFWAWYTRPPRPTPPGEIFYFLGFGLAVGLMALFFYSVFVRQTWKDDPVEREWRRLRRIARAAPDDDAARAREDALGKQVKERKSAVRGNVGREAISMIASNLVGGFLLWVAATRIGAFDSPVAEAFGWVGYRGGDRYEVLPYERWWGAEIYTTLAFPVYLFVIFLGITLFIGFTSRRVELSPRERERREREREADRAAGRWRLPGWLRHPFNQVYVEDEDREWLARASAWLFIVMAAWLFFSTLVLFGPLLYFAFQKWLIAAGGASALAAILGGRSASTPGQSNKGSKQGWRGMLESLGVNLVVIAAFVFFACLVLAVALLTGTVIAWLGYYIPALPFLPAVLREALYGPYGGEFAKMYPLTSAQNAFRVTHFPTWLYLLVFALVLHLTGRAFSHIINLNKFSLHAGYRDRIIRAFLGASRPRGERRENPFTGFDPRDNLHMQELRPQLLRESDFPQLGSLEGFVSELSRAGGRDPEAPGTLSERTAAFLRGQIEKSDGESLRYFKDPPETTELNASFRSALFGDLNRILQDKDIPDYSAPAAAAAAAGTPAAARAAAALTPAADSASGIAGGAARIRRNRERLKAAFAYVEDPPPPYRLMHVVNMALNLVGGDRLAWQQRRAESFTATPLHSGSLFVGYRRTRAYGGQNGISLGTAVAVSGAAASSNMGYFSPSVFVTFVLTFFNARLGWWLGNPGVRGVDTYFRSHPKSALSPILDEAFGLTDDQNPYVLLSDGGHFENLGLYEMVVRRCRNIFVVDGSADPEGALEGLGDAVRKIRIDLGIPIEFKPPFPILPRPRSEEREGGGYCAVGDIHYEAVDAEPAAAAAGVRPQGGAHCAHGRHSLTGRLVYIKPTIYGTEPRDIFNYARSHLDFPHESTADQFFDEPQFESHRMLGYYILEQLFAEALAAPEGQKFCEERDLQKFIDWLDVRAEQERGKALAGKSKGD